MTNEEKMTSEEAIAEISFLKVAVNKVMEQALDMAIKALSQEPCDDAVSRKAVYRLVDDIIDNLCENSIDLGALESWGREQVMELPSVTQKSGKWITDECGNVICSECKRFRRDCRYGHTNYCNHCGAKMVEPKESEDKE